MSRPCLTLHYSQSVSQYYSECLSLPDVITATPPLLVVSSGLGIALVDVRSREICCPPLLFPTLFDGAVCSTLVSAQVLSSSVSDEENDKTKFTCLATRALSNRTVAFDVIVKHPSPPGAEKSNESPVSAVARSRISADSYFLTQCCNPPPQDQLLPYSVRHHHNDGQHHGRKMTAEVAAPPTWQRRAIKSSGYNDSKQQPVRVMFRPQINTQKASARQKKKNTAITMPAIERKVNNDDDCSSATKYESKGQLGRARWSLMPEEETIKTAGEKKKNSLSSTAPPARFCACPQVWTTEGAKNRVTFCPPLPAAAAAATSPAAGSALAACSSADSTVQVWGPKALSRLLQDRLKRGEGREITRSITPLPFIIWEE